MKVILSVKRVYVILILYSFLFLLILLLNQAAWADAPEGPSISVQDGNLTVKVTDVSLAEILGEIVRQVDIKIYGETSLIKRKISAEFNRLKVHEGLARLLNGYNVAYVYAHVERDEGLSEPNRLTEVWVFSNGDEVSGERGTEKGLNLIQLSGMKMESLDPAIRRKAVEAMSENQDPAVIPVLLNFLRDQDKTVRLAAINALSEFGNLVPKDQIAKLALGHSDPQTRLAILSSGIDLPHEPIIEHALHDPSPQVRITALQTLEGEMEIEELAKQARKDHDPSVRAVAEEILKALEEEDKSMQADQERGLQDTEE